MHRLRLRLFKSPHLCRVATLSTTTQPGPQFRNPRNIFQPHSTSPLAANSNLKCSPQEDAAQLRNAVQNRSLLAIHQVWRKLKAGEALPHLEDSDVRQLADALENILPALAPSATTDADSVRHAKERALGDAQELVVFVASRGHLAPLDWCMHHALSTGDESRTLDLWYATLEEFDALPIHLRSPHKTVDNPRPAKSPAGLTQDSRQRTRISLSVLSALALRGDYRNAILAISNHRLLLPAEDVRKRLIPQILPSSWPSTSSESVLEFIKATEIVASMLMKGPRSETLAKFANGNNPEVLYKAFEVLVHGTKGDNPWCSLTPKSDVPPIPKKKSPVFYMADPVWSSIAAEFVRCNRVDLAQTVVDTMRTSGLEPSTAILNTLLDGYGKAGNISAAKDVWDKLPNPDVYAYTTMISTLFQNHQVDEALSLFHSAQQAFSVHNDSSPSDRSLNITTYNAVIHGLLINNLPDRADDLCAQMRTNGPKPDTITYNTFLRYFSRTDNREAFVSTLQTLSKEGLQPDIYTYTTIVDTLLQHSRHNVVARLLDMMQSSNIPPSAATYTAIIDYFIRRQGETSIRTALALIEKMESEGIPTNEVTYTSLLSGVTRDATLSKSTSSALTNEIVSRMKQKGLQPNRVTHNFLIQAALSHPSPTSEVMYHWERIKQQAAFVPAQTYFIILQGLLRRREWSCLEDVLEHMTKAGFEPRGALERLVRRVVRELQLRA
ncbi:hypothetical protein FRB99_001507 [Tulasnella sp. 403]|nr:hypothetical protein FRB99_001507 [Tulasnella sp. 403]